MSSTTEENDDIMEGESSRIFTEALVDQVNKADVLSMVELQTEMLSRYEKTNEMLINFNMLSLARYEVTSQEFKQHTQLLYSMKKDLDVVFRRIRTLKQRLGSLYPEAFAVCSDVYNILDEEEKDAETKSDGSLPSKQDSSRLNESETKKADSKLSLYSRQEAVKSDGDNSKPPNINVQCETDTDREPSSVDETSVNAFNGGENRT